MLWIGRSVSTIGTQIRIATIGWHIYVLTHDPLQLGVIGLCRVVPLVLFALVGGSAADALERRRLLLITQCVMFVASATLAVVTLTGTVTVWWIYGITIVTSAANAFDMPTYSALLPSLVEKKDLPNAISLNSLAFQTATVVGPGLGGIIIARFGIAEGYVFDAATFCVVIVCILLMHYRPVHVATNRVSVASAVEGLRFVFSNRILVSTMLLDFFATFFAGATTLLPIFATDVLHTGAEGFGVLSAAQAVGAFLMSIGMAYINVQRIPKPGIVLLVAVLFYGVFTIFFGLSDTLWLSVAFLALVGASDTVSMVLRQTIAQLVTPDQMRGRMQAVNMIFFAGGPQLGELEAGAVAKVAGAPFAVVTGGIACCALVGLVVLGSKQLRGYTFEEKYNPQPLPSTG